MIKMKFTLVFSGYHEIEAKNEKEAQEKLFELSVKDLDECLIDNTYYLITNKEE